MDLSISCDFIVESASDLDPDPDPDPDPSLSDDRDPRGVLAPVERKFDSLLSSMGKKERSKYY